MAGSDPLLDVSDIHTYYGESYVLHGLSLSLEAGRIVVILGRNGMGKTTLVRSICGLTPPRHGTITFKGRRLSAMPAYAIAQEGIVLVPQGRRIFKSLTVRENLRLPTSTLAGGRKALAADRKPWTCEDVLSEFPQLADRLDNLGGALSGGEQQMLAICRALMANPELILMDEPSEGLSPKLVQRVEEILLRLRDQGHAILLVEQNLRLALAVADTIYVISSGRFVFKGSADELSRSTDVLDSHLGVTKGNCPTRGISFQARM